MKYTFCCNHKHLLFKRTDPLPSAFSTCSPLKRKDHHTITFHQSLTLLPQTNLNLQHPSLKLQIISMWPPAVVSAFPSGSSLSPLVLNTSNSPLLWQFYPQITEVPTMLIHVLGQPACQVEGDEGTRGKAHTETQGLQGLLFQQSLSI